MEYIVVHNVLNYASANKSFGNVNKNNHSNLKGVYWKMMSSCNLIIEINEKDNSMSKSEESSWCQISWPKIPYYNQRAKARLVAPVSLVNDETRAVFD